MTRADPHAGGAGVAAAVADRQPTSAAPVRRRNLVVLRAGDGSLHREWIAAPGRDFDLFISYYGSVPERYRGDADFHEVRRGPKWPGLAQLMHDKAGLIEGYDAVWLPDDDLRTDTAAINRLFAFFHAYQLHLAQPALTRDSFHTWSTLLQDPSCHLRFTGFVEVMAPLFSRPALQVCAPTFAESPSGWGLDWVWPALCRHAGLDRIAVVDATPVCHTRPVGGELYRNHPALSPRADARQVVAKYGVEEVRAVAKYSVARKVREVPLPARERLLYWLKRLNGRRKHAFGR